MAGKFKRAVAITASLAALSSMPSSERQSGPVDAVPLTPAEIAAVQQDFNTALAFWAGRGVRLHTRLAIVSGDASYDCFPQTVTSGSESEYCPQRDTVVITAASVQGFKAENLIGVKFVLGHEVGHAVQGKEGKLLDAVTHVPDFELGATCLGGMQLGGTDPGMVVMMNMVGFIGGAPTALTGSDGTHGTEGQQEAAFYHGFTQQNCKVYGF